MWSSIENPGAAGYDDLVEVLPGEELAPAGLDLGTVRLDDLLQAATA